MSKVYLAGPITGQSYGQCTDWRDDVQTKLHTFGIQGFSPMRGKAYLSTEDKVKDSYADHTMASINGINVRDYNDCKTADVILANFIGCGSRVSIGTVMELAWGRAFQIPVVIVMEEDNVHNHGMLTFGNIVVSSLAEGIKAVREIILP